MSYGVGKATKNGCFRLKSRYEYIVRQLSKVLKIHEQFCSHCF